jgi:hypothetical protein
MKFDACSLMVKYSKIIAANYEVFSLKFNIFTAILDA